MSLHGTKQSLRCRRRMSVVGGEAENISSVRVFRILTHNGTRSIGGAVAVISQNYWSRKTYIALNRYRGSRPQERFARIIPIDPSP
jgi:hypothetical protein